MPLFSKKCFFISSLIALVLPGADLSGQFIFKRTATLSHNTAFSIMQDRSGFMWIGTGNGLNRFDGTETKVFKPLPGDGPGKMKGRLIKSRLLEDQNERIWFSTDIGVHCYDKKKDRFYQFPLQGRNAFANPVAIQQNVLWLSTISEGIYELDIITGKSTQYPLTEKDEEGNSINLMYHGADDGNNTIWFASNKGLLSFNTVSKKWRRYLNNTPLYAVAFCRDTIFAAEGKMLRWFDTKNSSSGLLNFKTTETIHTLTRDRGNNIWIGDAKGGIYQRKPDATTMMKGIVTGDENGSTGFPVYSLYPDVSGTLWAGLYSMGIWKAETGEKLFNTWPGENENTFINTIYEEDDGTLLLGTFDKGIITLDKATRQSSEIHLPNTNSKIIYGRSVPLIREDTRGNLWSSISGHLQVRKKNQSTFKSIKLPVPSNALLVPQLWCISPYGEGWIAGTTIGLYYISADHKVRHLPHFGLERIFNLWVSPKNEIWIAHESGGVVIAKNMDHTAGTTIFPDHNIRSFEFQEENKLLWLSSSAGIIAYHLPSGEHKIYTETQGLLNSYISGIITINDELWVSTDNGISKANIRFVEGNKLPELSFTNFTTADGLPDNSFNARAFHRGKSGYLYFGTPKGLVWFLPGNVKVKRSHPPLRMISILVNDKPADSIAPEYIRLLSLSHKDNNLFFRFRGIDHNHSDKLNYAYQLQGWDKGWIFSNNLNEARYSNLPHGNYTFKVRVANPSGEWNNDFYSVEVLIKAPFWSTWWFRTLLICSLLVIIVSVTRYVAQNRLKDRIRELEKQKALEEERKRISREMHDDIGAGLTRITLISEIARHNENKKELAEIAETSRQLVSNMSEIIWSIDPAHRTLEQLLWYLREQLNKLLEPSGIDYAIHFPPDPGDHLLTNEQKRNILLVTKEIVHNAVKHSKAGHISINCEIKDDQLCFIIKDNGQGFDKNAPASGNGLKNLEHRFKQLYAEYEIATAPGNGVTTRFEIPLKSH